MGAGRGIGLALAKELLESREIGTLWCTARSKSEQLDALAAAYPEKVRVAHLDAEDETSVAAAAAAVAADVDALHLAILSIGVLHDSDDLSPEKRLEQLDGKRLARYFSTNTIGPLLVAKHFYPLLRHEERAVLAALSARVGSIDDNRSGGWYGYRASKAALNMGFKTLSIELSRRAPKLICALLHPGTVKTDLSAPYRRNVPDERLFSPSRAARQLLEVLRKLDRSDSGGFFAWDGSSIAW
ncbi:MAG: SDR family oxidoreductase [Myxococcales bacterium]|nr:SDR family oxidoreductase [Myxococcales bacterium]